MLYIYIYIKELFQKYLLGFKPTMSQKKVCARATCGQKPNALFRRLAAGRPRAIAFPFA
jgi:hypothetical protein